MVNLAQKRGHGLSDVGTLSVDTVSRWGEGKVTFAWSGWIVLGRDIELFLLL